MLRVGSAISGFAATAVRTTRMIRNVITDARLGGFFAGEFLRQDDSAESSYRGNSDHSAIRQIFEGRVRPDDVLVDVGCGPGRVIASWLDAYPANRIVGIELNPTVAARAARRFRTNRQVSIVAGDAVDNLPDDGTVFYLFNPFNRAGIVRLEARLRALRAAGRQFRVLYHNPKHLDVFANPTLWACEEIELKHSPHQPFHSLAVIEPVPAQGDSVSAGGHD